MPNMTKFYQFVEDLAKKKHDLSNDTLKMMLSNVAPAQANTVKADITEIAAGNGYAAGGYTLAGVGAEQVAGVLSLTANDFDVTASGGAMAAWRYAVLYNDTAVNDPLIGFWDRGSSVVLGDGEAETLDLTTGNLLTIT